MKETKRTGFSFLRSYFDVLNELKEDEDKLAFLMAVINKQFLDEDPKGLDFVPNLCYESQRHQIEKSVKGWKTAKNTDLKGNKLTPPKGSPKGNPKGGTKGGAILPPKEEQEKEKEKEKVKDIDPILKVLNQSENSKHEPLIKTSYKNFMNVLSKECPTLSKIPKQLNIDTYYKLVNEYGKDKLGLELEKMDLWIEEKGAKRKDVNASIKRWLKNGY